MNYDYLVDARDSPGWKFLASDNVAMVASFLHKEFVKERTRKISHAQLARNLADYLDHIKEDSEELYSQRSENYLRIWTDSGWLRKFEDENNEVFYDIMPEIEQSINWIASLSIKKNVGTESRMVTLINLMRQIVTESDADPIRRLEILLARKHELDKEIEDVQNGRIEVMSPERQRDFFFNVDETSRNLLSDFRQVEQNFRSLHREMRKDIAKFEGVKGDKIRNVLIQDNAISESEQGKSFTAFFNILLTDRISEFERLMKAMLNIPAIKEVADADIERFANLKYDLSSAGKAVQKVMSDINRQLNIELNTQTRSENKRVKQLVSELAALAYDIPEEDQDFIACQLDACRPEFNIIMSKPLYSVPPIRVYNSEGIQAGVSHEATDALFAINVADRKRLAGLVNRMLETKPQVTLKEVLERYPTKQGLGEILTYLCFSSEGLGVIVDESVIEDIQWGNEDNRKTGKLPRMTFTRPVK